MNNNMSSLFLMLKIIGYEGFIFVIGFGFYGIFIFTG